MSLEIILRLIIGFIVLIFFFRMLAFFGAFNSSPKEHNPLNKAKEIQKNDSSVTLKGMGETRVILPNVYKHILTVGGAGSGKSESVIIPVLKEFAEKEFSGLLYDYKHPTLTNIFYEFSQDKDINLVNFNFETLETRINPIAPQYIPTVLHVSEVAKTFLQNLNKANRKEDFWTTSATNYLTSVIWFLKVHHPEQCTLPHAIKIVLSPVNLVVDLLKSDPVCKGLVQSIITGVESEASGQVSGVVGTLQNSLSLLAIPELFYLFSGNDVDLAVNKNNTVLILGNDPTVSVYSSFIAAIISQASKLMNKQGRKPSFICLDEAPTVYLPNFDNIPATARSNKIAVLLGIQDFAQFVKNYSKDEKDSIIANMAYQFFGRTTNADTQSYIIRLFGKFDKLSRSTNSSTNSGKGGSSSGASLSLQQRDVITSQMINDMNAGDFLGILGDSNYPLFNGKLRMVERKNEPRQEVDRVPDEIIMKSFNYINSWVENLLNSKPEQPTESEKKKYSLDEL
jgi:type IV secretory pathway TraG/TraD family ATPase VirD4